MPIIDCITISDPETDTASILEKYFPECYALGENVLFKQDGSLWNRMEARATEYAIQNAHADSQSNIGKNELITIRKQVHMRPCIFIDKQGNRYDADTCDTSKESMTLLNKMWIDALQHAKPTDIFTHWTILD